MVVVNGYSAEQATVLFQMGVDEYVCAIEHGERLGAILNALINRTAVARTTHLVRAATLKPPVFRLPLAASSS
jgi:hypothetical protein